jgi:Ca2+-binding EF-hand superfamily protein
MSSKNNPPPVISPVKKSARLGKHRSLISKSTKKSGRLSRRSSSSGSLKSYNDVDTARSLEMKLQKQIKFKHNKGTDELWKQQRSKAVEKDKETSAKKAALDVFEKLHAFGEMRYRGDHEEITNVYHMIEHDTIDFDNFYHVLQEHYFDKFVTKQSALNIFNFVDVEKKGKISFDQLHHVYNEAVKHLGAASKKYNEPNTESPFSATAISPPKKENSLPNLVNLSTTQKAIAMLSDEEMILRKKALQRMNELKYKIQQKLMPKVKSTLENLLRATYKIADVNADGNLSYEEFGDWLGNGPTGLNIGFNDDDVRDVTLACDADLDGGISVDEFITFVTRKNKLDPRTFLNDKRQERVDYMRSLRRRTLKNLKKKVDDTKSARSVDTDHSTQNELSTRLWYNVDKDKKSKTNGKQQNEDDDNVNVSASIDEDDDGYNFSHLDEVEEIKAGPRRLGHTIEADLERYKTQKNNHRSRFYAEGDQKSVTVRKNKHGGVDQKNYVPVRRNMKKSFSSPMLSTRSSALRRSKFRSRRPRKIIETYVDIDSAEHHQLPGGDVNALYSKINFENMAKEIWSGRWDGRGRDFKPDWVNRLTFNRVGLGGDDGISQNSAMYQSEKLRRKNLLNETASTVNPAGKFVDENRAKMVIDNDMNLVRKRFYLRKNRRAMRTQIKQLDHNKRMADKARIFNKTSQQLRYLEVLNEIEKRKIDMSYQTKGLIKSPVAARMKAGSIQLFCPPSGREEKNSTLQTGIGTRAAAIVNWAY